MKSNFYFLRYLFLFGCLFLFLFHQIPATQITFAVGINSATLCTFDKEGNLYVSAFNESSVYKITQEGNVSIFAQGFSNPAGLAFDQNGYLYVVNNGTREISKVDSSGTSSVFVTIGGEGDSILGLAVDDLGYLYAVNQTQQKIVQVAPNGIVINPSYASGFLLPTDIAFDKIGNLYVSDPGANCIWKVNSGGGAVSVFATGFNSPYGLVCDSLGHVYVSNSGDNTILWISKDGLTTTSFVTTLLSNPYGIALDDSGNLYIANNSSSSITQVTPNISIEAPSTVTIGTSIPFIVTALNDNGDLATSYTGTLQFTSTDSHATLPLNSQLTEGIGTFNLIFNEIGCQTITATDIKTPLITATSNPIQVISPTVIGLCPPSGPGKGGTDVVIYGINLFGVKAVYFGEKPASSFTINSETSISATTPCGSGTVPVTLVFTGGRTEGENYGYFTYTAPPPLHLCGRQIRTIGHGRKMIFQNILEWKAPNNGKKLSYRIYRDEELTHLIGTVHPKQPLRFIDCHHIKRGVSYYYSVVSVDECGNLSFPVTVKIKKKKNDL